MDSNDELIGSPVPYYDGLTNNMMENVLSIIPKTQIFEKTVIQFLSLNTIYQLMSLVDQSSDSLRIAKTFLMIPDLLIYWLTRKKVCEFSNKMTIQLFNPFTKNWDYDLIEFLYIPKNIFPEMVQPGTKIDQYNGIPVITPACHDTESAVAAVPADTWNFAYISNGTWSLVDIENDKPVINELALELNITNEVGVYNTYRFLKNVTGLRILQKYRNNCHDQAKIYS